MTLAAYDISVIICAYTNERWNDLVTAVGSIKWQTLSAREIIIVVDHNLELLKLVQEYVPGVVVVENTEARGLRGARNCGIAVAQSEIIAFLDDDAIASPDWLMHLCGSYTESLVMGTGGEVIPSWESDKPAWLPEEFYWVVGCSYRGMPQTVAPIRNPIGANMSFRQEVFDKVGDFHSEIEQIGKRHAGGCEETELCIRVQQYWPGRIFLYQPQARVFHNVPNNRANWRYFCSRCYVEGLAKSIVARHVGTKDSLASERSYTLHTLPQGVVRGLTDTIFHRDSAGIARASAIIIGLAVTTLGYLVGTTFLKVSKLKSAMAMKKIFHNVSEIEADSSLKKDLIP